MMTEAVNHVFAAAMALDAESRRDLAERLWDAVQIKGDAVFSETTWDEIGRRVAASDAGQVEHVQGDVVRFDPLRNPSLNASESVTR